MRRIAIGKTFRQHWEAMDGEQRHAYLKLADRSGAARRGLDRPPRPQADTAPATRTNPVISAELPCTCRVVRHEALRV
ncbi:MAG TPA: hypothetical protein VI365_15910 [Trebonia sp.]